VFVNTAVASAGGDRFDIEIADRSRDLASAVTTAAAEKVYRAAGPPSQLISR